MQNQNKVVGRFFFKRTDNENLIGEFSNNCGKKISTESADLMEDHPHDGFIGTYHSTWQEGGEALFAELKISSKGGSNKLFRLEWRRDGNLIFEGEGMRMDGVLIGDYHQSV